MKKYLFLFVTAVSLALFPGRAHAQRYLPGMKGVELRGGFANGSKSPLNHYAGFAVSGYTKRADRWVIGAEYLMKNYGYRNVNVPCAQFTAEGGYYLKFLSDPSRTVFLSIGGSAMAGYETVNWGDRMLFDGSTLLAKDAFVRRGDEYWYLAPYREERTASFQVNVRKEIWHDFGTGQGGDIFNLAGEFIGSGDFKAQARFITETWGGLAPEHKTVSRTDGNDREDIIKKESFTNVRFGPLYNRVLLRYLAERGISSDVAVPNCREVRYTLHGKRYFAIGFRNVSDGYELRNRFFKASLSPKDISLMDNGSDTCNLFEGFIDCLSWLELGLGYGDDYLVLNSVSLLERSFPILDRYERINCYLDRDEAGRRTLEALRKRYADKLVDCSSLYKGYKDLNEYLQHKFL